MLRNTEARPAGITEARKEWDKNYDVGTCLNNLGALYDEMGDYAQAEEMYLRSLSLADQLTFLKVTDENYLHGALSLALLRREDTALVLTQIVAI